jgi:DNA-binding transcriptional regulator YiaG
MAPEQLAFIRDALGLGRREFALLLGYTGSAEQNWIQMKRMETGAKPITETTARLALLIYRHWRETGRLPVFDMGELPAPPEVAV